MAEELAVWLDGVPVAELSRRRSGDLAITYDPELVAARGIGALCLSVALPLTAKPYIGRTARRWLEGLLPEGETRTALEEAFGVDRGDTFGLLAAIGRDCAGAVAFLPPGEQPSAGELEEITDDQLADIIDSLPEHPLGAQPDVPVSLAGLQQKLLLARLGGGWARPRRGAPSTHILKPDPAVSPGLVASEALSLRAAALAGIDVAHVELIDVAGRPVLVVERYDRRRNGPTDERLHQEDGCQALGLEPTGMAKYERKAGDPSYDQLAAVLSDHALDPRAELGKLAMAMTCNVALQNVDGHARNHSFLIVDGAVSFAPLYDIAPTVEFTKLRTAALRVGGEDRIERISAVHLAVEARSWGISRDAAEEVVIGTLERLFETIPTAAEGLPVSAATVKRMRGRVRDLLQRWRRRDP
jgi:serine/threonine-protein kinase HipA